VYQEFVKSSTSWIDWYGGLCPVDDKIEVEVRFRNGEVYSGSAQDWRWIHINEKGDIVAYRVLSPSSSELDALESLPDDEIDYSDIPEIKNYYVNPRQSGKSWLQSNVWGIPPWTIKAGIVGNTADKILLDSPNNKYLRPYPYDTIDIYRVLQIYEVTDPCIQHAVKKLLCAGKRGYKEVEKDVEEAIMSLQRWEEMRREERV
jgi:hypothetical protein